MSRGTPYFEDLRGEIARHGGVFNAHLHLDRSGTLEEMHAILRAKGCESISDLSLEEKHELIPTIHESKAYDPELLGQRASHFLDLMEEAGTTRADTLVDVAPGRVGLGALRKFLELKQERRHRLDLRVGAYTPLGFKDSEPERWELFAEGARLADFVGALPERDDQVRYPEHVGFRESCRRVLLLGQTLGKPLHIHVDQANSPDENWTETLIEVIEELGLLVSSRDADPLIWLVHVISPSTYPEERFDRVVEALVEHHLGVICCPSAALSMRQVRSRMTPTGNSIARVLEMLAAGIHVRLGSDNLCDITSPAGTVDLVDELFLLSNAIRFYEIDVLSKLGAGRALSAPDREKVTAHLERDTAAV